MSSSKANQSYILKKPDDVEAKAKAEVMQLGETQPTELIFSANSKYSLANSKARHSDGLSRMGLDTRHGW